VPRARSGVPFADGPWLLEAGVLVRAVVDDVSAGTAPAVVAARFHRALATAVVEVCDGIRGADRGSALGTVALSGGVFQNSVLLDGCARGLAAAGFTVLTHRLVPPGDGGISLGQAVVAGARDRDAAARAARGPGAAQWPRATQSS
jgi:hydrogenase maturation protein HypF